ncbi:MULTISPECIES: ABC transporter ATP-binding protein [unclassified Granulicatella]|uniref:ABC transporter ATP-binding protein n=1 Tax=unclassified Granulicatella TaxID=2630493 RepID=UPI001074203B|nr:MULTISPECIES: ABC transporter ATP-binding protein [unclassified Granulicatella]MBF0780582.1 ABC transporter ATP-binding protein [Granulicatella sp. 19428wC4_WM01]TFU94891.1 ABC transporter ATP-binding protein [Granulicatella sp. WM01]
MTNQNKTKKVSYRKVFFKLLKYMFVYKWTMIAALLFLVVMSIVESTIPLVARHYIDTYLVHQDTPTFHVGLLAGYYALFVLQLVLTYTGSLLFARVSFSVVRDIRQDAFSNLQQLNMQYFDRTPSGSIVARITNDTQAIATMFSDILSAFIRASFVFSATLYTMLSLDWSVTLMIVILLPIVIMCVSIYRKLSTPLVMATRSRLSDLNVKLAESIEGMRIIQAFGQEQRLIDEFETINQEHLMYANRTIIMDSLMLRPAMSLLKLLAYALLMAYFGITWQTLGISAGLIYAFIQYINRLFNPLIQLTQNYSQLQTSVIAAKRVFDIIERQDYEPEQRKSTAQIKQGNIEFKDVCFSYDGQTQVLNHVSFSVKQGETIAFVGHTGSGKSSIINVFMRFYEFEQGQILIDGVDIKEYAQEELRKNVGLVLQDPFLFHGTIQSNIAMYQNLSDQDVEAAAKFVDAHQFIMQLPKQYSEPVTERGSTLSSGQRQLLAFARTMAMQPKILILDEATANIDSETEETIQCSLAKMRKGRTTIAIAHRLSTIQDANCIYVLDKGVIIEQGTHEELLQRKGTYYTMYQLQAGALRKDE